MIIKWVLKLFFFPALGADLAERVDHVALQLQQPFLHLAAGLGGGDDVTQLDLLPLAALHVRDVQDVRELQLGDALKALLQVRLHSARSERENDDDTGFFIFRAVSLGVCSICA